MRGRGVSRGLPLTLWAWGGTGGVVFDSFILFCVVSRFSAFISFGYTGERTDG
jgi:hypothetical protein